MMDKSNLNIAMLLPEQAKKYPDRIAVVNPEGRSKSGRAKYTNLTYSQLDVLSNVYANEFIRAGIVRGTKTIMLLRPGLDFIAAAFAVFKTGAVPVLIDPGMGRKNLLGCIKATAPKAMIAISPAHWIKLLFPGAFKSVEILVSAGAMPPSSALRLEDFQKKVNFAHPVKFEPEAMSEDDEAAILFTTGSTGPPKGVVYTHGMFNAQVEIISEAYGAGPGEIDMSAFALFALFAASMGMPSIIPDMDFTRPAKVDPKKIVESVYNQGVTFSFGSPALWRKVAEHCIEHNIKLPSLKKVLMAGAPVPADLHKMVKKIIAEDGETLVPYGATESLPVSSFTGSEMLAETADKTADGKGYCVGYPLKKISIKIIKAIGEAIENWDDHLVMPTGEMGEIVIKGPVVSPEYHNNPEATRLSKIKDSDGKLWHRMGDSGYFDEKGRLWFCGRKAHRVITDKRIFYPVCCEAIFNKHPDVFRSALVSIGEGPTRRPALIVEPLPGKMPKLESVKEKFISELEELGKTKDFTAEIQDFFFHKSFPVDIRHNAKIFREKLSIWADKQ